jgi:Leucine-rich repeat (LRR) protein
MLIENDTFKFTDLQAIVKLPSEKLFNFSRLTLNNLQVKSIKPEAAFLFANLSRLNLHEIRTAEIEHVTRTIDQFKAGIDFIELQFWRMKALPNFERLEKYSIKGLGFYFLEIETDEFYSTILSHAKSLSDIAELGLTLCSLKFLDSRLFEAFPSLVALNVSRNEIGDLDANVFARASGLIQLDLTENRIEELQEGCFNKLVSLRDLKIEPDVLKQPRTFYGLLDM